MQTPQSICYSHVCFQGCFRADHLGIRELTGVLFPGEDISPALRVPWLPIVLCVDMRPQGPSLHPTHNHPCQHLNCSCLVHA